MRQSCVYRRIPIHKTPDSTLKGVGFALSGLQKGPKRSIVPRIPRGSVGK